MKIEVPRAGFEPAISWLKTGRPGPLDERGGDDDADRREKSEGDGVRTRNLRIDSPVLCLLSYTPISLLGRTYFRTDWNWIAVSRAGFEPAISRLRTGCPGPLDERDMKKMKRTAGFEPAASTMAGSRSAS